MDFMPDVTLVTPAGDEREWIEELDVVPGRSDTRRDICQLEARVRERPAEWRLRLELAQMFASDGNFAASAGELRACRELVSDPAVVAGIFFNLGVCLENLERWREAASAYEQCLFLLPNLFWGRVNLGTCWMRLGEWPLAVKELRHAVSLDNREPEVYRALRDALKGAGLAHEAGEAHSRLEELGRQSSAAEGRGQPN